MSVNDDVIQRAIAGDRCAQRTIFESLMPRIHQVVGRIVGNSDADDVTQETFVTAFDKLSEFRGDALFSTWLHRIAIHKAIRFKQNRDRRETLSLHEGHEPTHELSNRQETIELVKLAMSKLEPELATILHLKEIDRMSYAEIALMMDIPEGTVGSRLNRARAEMREKLSLLGWEA